MTGLVLPGREALLRRLAAVQEAPGGHALRLPEHEDYVETVSPWGNRIRCHAPDAPRFGRIALGMPYVEFVVAARHGRGASRASTARSSATPARVAQDGDAPRRVPRSARTNTSSSARAIAQLPPFDGHHVQIYAGRLLRPLPSASSSAG